MDSVEVEGGALQAWSVGSGEPVQLIHGAVVADAFSGMAGLPELAGYRFLGYRRRGYVDSAPVVESSIEAYARDALAVMDHYGIERAHVVAHSFGGRIGLEVCRQAPERVHTFTSLEGAGPADIVVPSAADFMAGAGAAGAAIRQGDQKGATELLMAAIAGDGWRDDVDRVLGEGWFDQAVADIVTVFTHDLPSASTLTSADAEGTSMPSLVVIGADSVAYFRETSEAVAAALPNSETVIIEGANHLLQITRPAAVAAPLAAFLGRHPMS
jgi:pimeloyl-ACP methyl ester carboxylesterase